MTTDPSEFNMTEMGIAIEHEQLQYLAPEYVKYTPEAMALVRELTTNITAILTESITTAFTALKTSIHERPIYVLFEPQLGCDPLTDHQTPKDVYPIFSEAISSAEKKLGETSVAMIVDELREKIAAALSLEVSKTNVLKAKAEDALGELATLKAKLLMKDKLIQQLMQSKSEEHSKLLSEITVLREQAFMKRRFGDRYKPDNIDKAIDDGQQQSLGGSLMGSTGEFVVNQGNQANKMIRDQLATIVAENKELKLKLEAAGLAHKKLEELEGECAVLKFNIQTAESSHEETLAKLESDLKEKTLLISTYQDNERALNTSVQELTKQLRLLEKRRPTSSDITSRTDTDLSKENAELKSKVFELQEKLMATQVGKKQDSVEDTSSPDALLSLRKELQEKATEADSYRQKLEEAGLLNAPAEAFIKLSEHNASVAALQSQLDTLETQNQDLVELSNKLQRQIDHLIENEAAEINNVLEANELLHKQKLKNAVEAAVCIDSFNESIQAAKRAITNFDDFGCQVPDKRARKSTMRSGEEEELDTQDNESGREDAEASRIRRAIDAARKIYANRLPTVSENALSYDVSSVDEVFKQLFDTAKTAKTQLMKKHQETLQTEAQALMRNLNLHDRIARAVSNYTNFTDQPPKDPLKLLSKEQLRDVLSSGVDIGLVDDSSPEQEDVLAKASSVSHEEQHEDPVNDDLLRDIPDAPPAKPDGPAPRSRKRRASPSKNRNSRSTLSTPISSSTRPATRKSGTMLSGTTTSRASELDEVDGEKDFFRASVPSNPARETFSPRASTARSVASDSDSDDHLAYTLADNGKRMALTKHTCAPRHKDKGRRPRLLIRLLRDKLSGEVRDELGRLVSLENLYMYGYCMNTRGDLVYYGDCSVTQKASDDSDTIIRKFPAGDEGELILPNGQRIPREDALRFGYKGPARNGTYIFTGQPADLYDQVMRLSPDGISAMMTKILGKDIEYDDIIAGFNLKLDLDEVTQRPYVYVDTEAVSLQESALDTSHIFPQSRITEFLHKVDPESLKVPEEDAFKLGILPDASGAYRYARPVLHLSQADDLLVADPQGNEIKVEDALEAGYVGPFGSQQEYYYFSPIPPGETRTCELVSNGSKLRIITNNDEASSYEVAVADAYKYGFLPTSNGEYHYAGDLPYLRELDTDSNILYDLLDKPVDRTDAEKHGYLRRNDGRYYYIGSTNLPQTAISTPDIEPQSIIDICDSSWNEQSGCDGINTENADITLLYDKHIDVFVERDTGYVVDNKAMLRDYGYLIDNANTPHFVGVGNAGTILPNDANLNTVDQSKTIITGYDNKIHVYDQANIDAYYENNVAIIPKRLDIVKLQKRLELVNDPNQLKKMTKHMQRLEKTQLASYHPPVRDASSCSSEKVSILIDDGIAKSTILNVKDNEIQNLMSNDLSKAATITIEHGNKQATDAANDLVMEELIHAQVQPPECVSERESTGGVSNSVVHIEPSDSVPKKPISTLSNCTIIDATSLGTDLEPILATSKAPTILNVAQEFPRSHLGYAYSPDRTIFKRNGPGLVVTSYGSVDDSFKHVRSPRYKAYLLTPSSKGRIVIQNIIKPSPSIGIRPLFDREAGIVFDEQTNKILGQVNEITGDIEDTTGRTIGHIELMSRTIRHNAIEGSPKEALRHEPIHALRSTTISSTVTPLKRSHSHDPRRSAELTQENSVFGEFIETPLRAISNRAELVINTPTHVKTAGATLFSSSIKQSSLRRSLIDPKSGRTTRGLDKSGLVLVTLHDPDASSDLDPCAVTMSQINMQTEIIPRGSSAPARGSFGLSDTGFKEDSVVSMHDGVFSEIKDRTCLGVTPAERVRATSHRAIGSSPSIIPGMHNPAPPSVNTLHAEGKTVNALSNTLSTISQKLLDPTVQHTSSKYGASTNTPTHREPIRRAQSMRYATGHMLPSMELPYELLRRPYYKDATSKWVPYTQITIVPDDSKMLSGSHAAPLSILQNLTCHMPHSGTLFTGTSRPHTTNDASEATSLTGRAALTSDDEDLIEVEAERSKQPRVLPPVRYSKKSATKKYSASTSTKHTEMPPLNSRDSSTLPPPRGASNPVFSERASQKLISEIHLNQDHSSKGIEHQCVKVDPLPSSDFSMAPPLLTSAVETTDTFKSISPKQEHPLGFAHPLIKAEESKEISSRDTAPSLVEAKQHKVVDQPRSLVTSRILLSMQSKERDLHQIHQPRIMQIVQDDLNASTSYTESSLRVFSAMKSKRNLNATGLAINTSPHRRQK